MATRLESLLQPHTEREVALREQLAHLQAQAERVRFELVGVQQRIQGIKEAAEVFQVADTPRKARRVTKRNRGMSAHWQRIMQIVDLLHDHFSYADLDAAAEGIGHAASNDALRSQMSDYKSRGWVESAGIGAFRLTDAGRAAASINQSSKDETPDVSASGVSIGRVAELEGPEKTEQRPFRKGENVGSSPTPPAPRSEPPPPQWDSDDDVPF